MHARRRQVGWWLSWLVGSLARSLVHWHARAALERASESDDAKKFFCTIMSTIIMTIDCPGRHGSRQVATTARHGNNGTPAAIKSKQFLSNTTR